MEITNEMVVDILDNLDDDELRLFVEHLTFHNQNAKEILYKYYTSLVSQKYIDKNGYIERIKNEIYKEKATPFSFVSFYELLEASYQKYLASSDDFAYVLGFESYIQLSTKYSKFDFDDIFDKLNNSIPLSKDSLSLITSKINLIRKNHLKLKINCLKILLKYINKDILPTYLECFYNIYELEVNKEHYLYLIDDIFKYLQRNFSLLKAIQFLEYFASENYLINKRVVSYYLNEEDEEKALKVLNKLLTTSLSPNEYKEYLVTKGNIYNSLGSKTLYYKSLIDLILHNNFEYFDILKKAREERDYLVSVDFIVDNLIIKDKSQVGVLHEALKDAYCDYGICKFFDYFDVEDIFEDIKFFKDIDIVKASNIYKKYILSLFKEPLSSKKISKINAHLKEYRNNYYLKDFDKFIKEVASLAKKEDYYKIMEGVI